MLDNNSVTYKTNLYTVKYTHYTVFNMFIYLKQMVIPYIKYDDVRVAMVIMQSLSCYNCV